MTQFLPPNLLALFAPRDPIPFLPQLEKLPHEKHHNQPYSGIAPFIRHFEDPRDAPPTDQGQRPARSAWRERGAEKMERRQAVVETELKLWDPHNDPNAQGDAFKTLFVARVNYDTTESKLRREFEVYGPIKRIYIVYNKRTGKPRGYAFIEYEHERDMHSAYKHADGKKIDGRRVLVDVERGRTVKGWHPRRLGGGLGGTRRGGADVNIKHSGRDDASRYDDRSLGGDRGDRQERSRERDRDKTRDRRRSRSRERRRRTRSRERERERERPVGGGDDASGSSRRRERERDRGVVPGGDSRSRERSRDRDRKRRSRSRDRKRDRERGKGLDGEDVNQGDGVADGGERVPEEHEGEVGEGVEERRDRDRDRDRRRRDRDRRRGDRDREHKRERGDRERGVGDRREERHGALREDMVPQEDAVPEEDGGTLPQVEEYNEDGVTMEQELIPSGEEYGSNENGYKMEAQGDEY
ncbi:LOW QUALITY PROTEIN: U1 small nuclear ribonucleoprotein 70 kDa-like [Thalassophryne amazonica]|uniref:LOW QUALITY PROTEIN: U1 small nuclear ribonucleoprotein 70 kDa-like n=1 Tax=Thalassophryne amazonica TaxID=390379 RepID=UPI00147255A8|nr:LOW QUALITY PROTEIN: U1 small nuclear ribonucleoprotein 70 kDa-like [Thalassophryne amazonica]